MKTTKPKLVVKARLWSKPYLTFKDDGKKRIGHSLQECRDYAEQHGYSGIKVEF